MNSKNKMETMNMTRLVFNMSLPLMISLLVQSLYNIVDSIFVAKLSEDALTATSLAFPIQILMIAVSVGTSVGINAILSQSIGARKTEETVSVATTGFILAIIGTVIFMLLGITCTKVFVDFFTKDEMIAELSYRYLKICMIFCLGTFIGTMYQRFLQAVGNTFDSMLSLIAGAIVNLVLDPILIFGLCGFPSLGIDGAAIATVIGQWVSAILAVVLNKKKNPQIYLKIRGYHPDGETIKKIYKVGLPTIITQAMGSIMVIAMNAILIPFSTTAVAFFGVYYKLQNFLFMPMNGLGQAAIPIVGYNFGAKNEKRVIEVFRIMIPIAVGIALLAMALFLCIPDKLLGLFSASSQMCKIGIPALRIISVTFALASVTTILGYAVSGLGNGFVNMMGTALRQFLILVPSVFLIAHFIGINHIWYAMWISETVAMHYAIIYTKKEINKFQKSLK